MYKNQAAPKTAIQSQQTKPTADQRQPETFFTTPPLTLAPPRTLHLQFIGAEGDKRRGEHCREGALSISIAIETTQGMMLLCDTVDTECCYQDIQWNKPKSHAYTQEKNIKGNNLLKVIYIIYIKEDRNPK
ncbi:Hypothetical predicted protein [Xyrichtys novacula]|uniref:Uncharacterized protein n=1 Tax=Xyrichtys novacula TaxID=13765 RepID=A0AAV1FBE0_XYRNO|nr:Hypothetical predicted protein [Xyrichtys novacula]